MQFHGQYIVQHVGADEEIIDEWILENLVPDEGVVQWLHKMFTNNAAGSIGVAVYFGLMNQTPVKTTVMADITTEPNATGGYARQSAATNLAEAAAGGFDVALEAGYNYAGTVDMMAFTAVGAAFSQAYSRIFMATAAALGTGTLLSISAAIPVPITVQVGETINVRYRFYMD